MRQRVVFAYRPRKRFHGARIMRVDQLCEIAKAHLGDRYDFSSRELFRAGQPRRQRKALQALAGAVVIFLKGSGACFDEEGLERLKAEAAGLCIDHVDAVVGVGPIFPMADVHIFSSYGGMRAVAPQFASGRIAGEAAFVTHHSDPRIVLKDHGAAAAVLPGYFGAGFNTVVPEALRHRFEGRFFDDGDAFEECLAQMPQANLHWAIRTPGWRGPQNLPAWKPFTKGFNAAWAGANVVVDRAEDDAVEFLGDDYPYLAEDTSAAAILDVFAHAERTVGGPEWRRGLAQMAKVRARTMPAVIAAELDAVLRRFA